MFLAPKVYSVTSVLDPPKMHFEPQDIPTTRYLHQIAEKFFADSSSLDARRDARVSGPCRAVLSLRRGPRPMRFV